MSTSKSDHRTQKAKKNIIAMICLKGITMLISFLYVPLLLHTLKTAEYAIWLTLTSLVAWVAMFDIGLGNGLRNKLSEALAQNNRKKGRELISTAYCCIITFVICLCILFTCIYNYVPWDKILNATNTDIADLNTLVLIVFLAFCCQFALGLINSILFALQLPAVSSLLLAIGQLFSFLAVLILTKYFEITSLLILGSLISIIPPIVLLISTIMIFKFNYPDLAPNIHLFKKEYLKEIFSIGIIFFILQLITIVLYQTNNLIIIHVVNDQAVVEYNVAYKYMHVLSMIFTIIVSPIWSATTEAYAVGDMDWIKRINQKLIKTASLFTIAGVLMLIISKFVYSIWLNDNSLNISFITTGLLLLQNTFFIFYSCYGYILNGIGKLRIQLIFTSVLAILYIPFALLLGEKWGLNGILFSFALNALLNVAWSKIQFSKITNGTARGIWLK